MRRIVSNTMQAIAGGTAALVTLTWPFVLIPAATQAGLL